MVAGRHLATAHKAVGKLLYGARPDAKMSTVGSGFFKEGSPSRTTGSLPWLANKTMERNPYKEGGGRGASDMWEDHEGVHFRFDIPGLNRDHVKVWVDKEGDLIIRGEGPAYDGDPYDASVGRVFNGSIKVRPGGRPLETKFEMKSGVLLLLVPTEEMN